MVILTLANPIAAMFPEKCSFRKLTLKLIITPFNYNTWLIFKFEIIFSQICACKI